MKSSCDDCGELLNSWDSGCRLSLCLFGCPSQFLTEKNPTRVVLFSNASERDGIRKKVCLLGLPKQGSPKNAAFVLLCVKLMLSESMGINESVSIGSERFIITAC